MGSDPVSPDPRGRREPTEGRRPRRLRSLVIVAAVVCALGIVGIAVPVLAHGAAASSARSAGSVAAAPGTAGTGGAQAGSDSASPGASATPSTSSSPSDAARSGAGLSPGEHTIRLRVGGRERSLILHVPPRLATGTVPLVLVFHGAEDTAAATVGETDFERIADDDGSLVAFLQGYADTWNEGAGHTPAERAGVNDVAFTAAALDRIESLEPVDRDRIAAIGFSNGALLTELLGCRLASRLTEIVPVSGPLPVSVSASCAPARPVSVLEIHGTADTGIPYNGGPFPGVGGGTTVLSAPASVARWAKLDGCAAHASTTSPSASVRIASYGGCRAGVRVSLRTLVGAGHSWPPDIGQLVAASLAAG